MNIADEMYYETHEDELFAGYEEFVAEYAKEEGIDDQTARDQIPFAVWKRDLAS